VRTCLIKTAARVRSWNSHQGPCLDANRPSFLQTTMSCCGESDSKANEAKNRQAPAPNQTIAQQPLATPGPQYVKPSFQQPVPGLAAPAPTYPQNGLLQQPTGGQYPGHSPQPDFSSYSPPTSFPTFPYGSTNSTLVNPQYPPQSRVDTTSPISVATTQQPLVLPPVDEGKMSVSIDFGEPHEILDQVRYSSY
jgi:hypothetical protein